jgi:hypothetical protein
MHTLSSSSSAWSNSDPILVGRCGDGWRLSRGGLTGIFAWVRTLRWRVVPRRIVLGALRDFLFAGSGGVREAGAVSSCYTRGTLRRQDATDVNKFSP